MMRAFFRREEGQSLVAIAAAFAVLLGAVAFSVDWGYALSERRAMVNAAQAGALGAGRMLATSVVVTGGIPVFNRSQQEVYCEAVRYATLNRGGPFGTPSYTLTVQYGDTSDPTVWTTSATATCPATSGAVVPASTRYVRVVSSVSYGSLLASVVGTSSITATGSARIRLAGASVAEGGVMWPMVRHYNPTEFQGGTCGNPCNPDLVAPTLFWSSSPSQGTDMVYGNFKGQADMSRYSANHGSSLVPSFLTSWDQSGSAQASPATSPKTDMSGNCTGGLWDTAGGEDPQQSNKQCSIPNWFYYGFMGRTSIRTDWSTVSGGQEATSSLGSRPAICPVPSYVVAPSCDNDRLGDWLETASGNLGSNNSILMKQRIQLYGKATAFSNNSVQGKPGTTYGKALVVPVYLWDCAETFSSSAPAGSQWSLIAGTGGDCSQIPQTGNTPTPNRVHVFTIAPFTFYEGLVDTNEIKGYWGGAFGDPDSCPSGTCDLNALTNTAFLVPDD